MDELLRSIWTAEETQAKASASIAGASAGMPPTPMQRQGSSLTLPRMLSTKTVDEAWRNLVRDEPPQGADGGGHQPPHRQSTLGEMTLEEFLVRAGAVKENPASAPPAPPPMVPPRPVPVAPKSSAFFGDLPGADDDAATAAVGFAPVGMVDLALIPPRAAGMGGSAMAVQTANDSGEKAWRRSGESGGEAAAEDDQEQGVRREVPSAQTGLYNGVRSRSSETQRAESGTGEETGRNYGNAEQRGIRNVEGSIRTEETAVLAKNVDGPLVTIA
ncbi:bZIP transcription factor TRAB1 isoform X1 [Zea mays]|uniref:bZIP transcription factor TRAB1 isoform X1 n=1 Tax=Zea mays TaxID=4577 RepID=UPI0009A9A623|nr:uncharacterized protein LOC100191233 isoform X1 [Zea mays]|eukprot:XP_020402923.1 putative bZIP transcription factor superfamily protein isoform X1 [Zea mays]